MDHAVATAILGGSLENADAIHGAWRAHVASKTHNLETLTEARDVLLKNVNNVLVNLWPTSMQPESKRKLVKDMPTYTTCRAF
jgi:hypothetical protein